MSITLTREQAPYVARLIYSDICDVCERGHERFAQFAIEDSVELAESAEYELRELERDIRMHRALLAELDWGRPRYPITVRWNRHFAESMAERLLGNGAADMREFAPPYDQERSSAYRSARREFATGAAIAAQLAAAA